MTMNKTVTSGQGELVLGAPDEPIRRQRQTVGHLENIDDALAGTFGMIEGMQKSIGDIYNRAQSCRTALWAIAGVLLAHVIRHW
jgi:hypothetical protein